VGDEHANERGRVHPGQIFHAAGRTDFFTNRPQNVVTGKYDEVENEGKPKRAELVRLNIHDFGEDALHQKALSSRAHARDLTNAGHVTPVGEVVRCAHDDIARCFFHAASTPASRSGVRPARNFDCRSCGNDLNQARVSRAVSATGRKVKPFASARSIFVRASPSSSPAQTGMSDHASTFCCCRNSAGNQVNVALEWSASLIWLSI